VPPLDLDVLYPDSTLSNFFQHFCPRGRIAAAPPGGAERGRGREQVGREGREDRKSVFFKGDRDGSGVNMHGWQAPNPPQGVGKPSASVRAATARIL
jgi:hypothetical protein